MHGCPDTSRASLGRSASPRECWGCARRKPPGSAGHPGGLEDRSLPPASLPNDPSMQDSMVITVGHCPSTGATIGLSFLVSEGPTVRIEFPPAMTNVPHFPVKRRTRPTKDLLRAIVREVLSIAEAFDLEAPNSGL